MSTAAFNDPTDSVSTQPTSAWISELAFAIANDGIAAHEPAVAHAVLLARLAAATQASVDILDDVDAPPVVRERAFSHLQRHWDSHLVELKRLLQTIEPTPPKPVPSTTSVALCRVG